MRTGLDTLGAQAFGAGQYTNVGVLCQRALAMCTLLSAAVSALWVYGAGPALVMLAVGDTVMLLHPPLPLVGVSIAMESERQQNDRTLADG